MKPSPLILHQANYKLKERDGGKTVDEAKLKGHPPIAMYGLYSDPDSNK